MAHKAIIVFATLILLGCEKEDSKLLGITFSSLTQKKEMDKVIIYYDEILGYDSCQYIYQISNSAAERLKTEWNIYDIKDIALAIDGKIIYVAKQIPGFSSQSFPEMVHFWPIVNGNEHYTIRMEAGYPSIGTLLNDPRNDHRIISRLKKDKKLITIN